ncbi:TonB-dependent receptor [Rhizorhapis suberifaciens]|uniref:Iron complex outermembrane receptor protein n=1 Tax=Rhizorhapis suberifaciens TaxID=13656 RepID=A0A840HZL5_9SPHN|nr:TonB-dependent receptor [Rhizorhapis suberifaciens]MBB4643009.1 iron complex outermembrane receptor protein [Rhizorhapis suberifaciens]
MLSKKTIGKVQVLFCLMSSAAALPAYAQEVAADTSASAQPADAAAAEGGVGDIVVTAQRRSERLQDVPVAITAVSPEVAQKLGIQNVRDLNLATPSTDIGENAGSIQMFMRGIGAIYVGPGLESPVAIYLDGAYLQRTFGMNSLLNLVDPGSIEILRGPQGTLYGRNATGGVVRVSSALPSRDYEGQVSAEYGRFDHKQVDGMLNVPLSDTLSVRVAGRYTDDGGYITNTFAGRKLYGGYDYTARGQLRWQPNEVADIVLGFEYQKSKKRKDAGALLAGAPLCYVCTPADGPPSNFYETRLSDLPAWRSRMLRSWMKASLSFDYFDLTSTTSYEDDKTVQAADNDFTPADIFVFDNRGVGGKTFTQEFQLASKLDGPFNYLVGINYLHDKAFFNVALTGDAYASLPAEPEVFNKVKTESISAFLEGSYQLTDQIKITAGGRYTYDKRRVEGVNNAGFQAFGAPTSYVVNPDFSAFTPRFVAAWDNGPTNIYYSFTRGFKAGGLSTPATRPGAIRPEKIFSHEIGIKNTALDGMLRTNLSVFYYKNKDLHVQIIDATSGGSITENAGSAEGYGAELEVTAQPSGGLVIGGSLSYLHADYVSYPNASAVCFDSTGTANANAPGAVLYACSKDYSGRRVPHAPRYQASINGSYTFDLGSWEANLAGVAQYRSSFDFFAGAGGDLGLDRQKGFVMANVSGYVSPPGGNLRLGFYVDNLFDKKYSVFTSTYQPYGPVYIAGEPITYGARIQYKF